MHQQTQSIYANEKREQRSVIFIYSREQMFLKLSNLASQLRRILSLVQMHEMKAKMEAGGWECDGCGHSFQAKQRVPTNGCGMLFPTPHANCGKIICNSMKTPLPQWSEDIECLQISFPVVWAKLLQLSLTRKCSCSILTSVGAGLCLRWFTCYSLNKSYYY